MTREKEERVTVAKKQHTHRTETVTGSARVGQTGERRTGEIGRTEKRERERERESDQHTHTMTKLNKKQTTPLPRTHE